MKMKTGKSKRKIARRLGLPVPTKNGRLPHRLRMKAYPLTPATTPAAPGRTSSEAPERERQD